jgi:hypothetical protein
VSALAPTEWIPPWQRGNKILKRVKLTPRTEVIEKPNAKLKILYLYSGKSDRPDGVIMLLRNLGHEATGLDLQNGDDLLDDTSWSRALAELGNYDFVVLTPPCGAFSPSRNHQPGPRPLRSQLEPYGLKSPLPPFTAAEKLALRVSNIHNVKSWIFYKAALALGLGTAFEAPTVLQPDQPSSFQFREAIAVAGIQGVRDYDLHQCMFGAETTKPTTFRIRTNGSIAVVQLALTGKCNHSPSWHKFVSPSGETKWQHSCHPPLVQRRLGNKWATSRSETYPSLLNEALVKIIVDSGIRQKLIKH